MLKHALLYPWDDGEAGTTLVIGGILTLLGILVLPILVVLGYWLRVIDSELDGDDSPPRFEGWQTLLIDGVKALVVLLAYLVVPFIIGAAIVAAILGAYGFRTGRVIADPGSAAAIGGLALLAVVLLAGLLLLLFYVTPAALALLAGTGELGRAFDLDNVRALARADAYASAWLVALAVIALETIVIGILEAFSIGVVLSGFVGFYAAVAVGQLYGRGVREAGLTIEPAPEPAAEGDEDEE